MSALETRWRQGESMLLDAIATVILAGLMLVPLINVIVGGVAGAGLLGPLGAVAGVLLALGITWLEVWLADCLGWRDLQPQSEDVVVAVADDVSPTVERTIKTRPPKPRRQSRPMQATRRVRRIPQAGKLQRGAARQ